MNLNVSQGSRQSVVCLPDDAEPASAELVRLDDRAAHLTVRLEQLLVPCHELPGVAQLCRGDVDRMGDLSSAEHAVPNRRVCDEGPRQGADPRYSPARAASRHGMGDSPRRLASSAASLLLTLRWRLLRMACSVSGVQKIRRSSRARVIAV